MSTRRRSFTGSAPSLRLSRTRAWLGPEADIATQDTDTAARDLELFKERESEVRGYIRSFPTVFDRASGARLHDADGRTYIDFFAGAGVLNYGHNPPALTEALTDYLASGGIVHSLDMATAAKARFIEAFSEMVLEPRGYDYKLQFPGPTGTNAVEAALKLARKVTGRTNVVAFTHAFHGMTLGSLATTANREKRAGAGVPLTGVTRMPYEGFLGAGVDSIEVLDRFIQRGSGMDVPAAIIVETVQAEGGVRPASVRWLQRLSELAKARDILLIVDDIQAGCGRTGPFFSFEGAGIEPDMVLLSKSLSGFGLPFALVLLKPELDVWDPGEHNGTFRGHNLAFVTAVEALKQHWSDTDGLEPVVMRKGAVVEAALNDLVRRHPDRIADSRGRGLLHGLEFRDPEDSAAVAARCFEEGLVIETSGPDGEVLKVLPPLTIDDEDLRQGLTIIDGAVSAVVGSASPAGSAA